MASEVLGDITEIFCCNALEICGLKEGVDYARHKKIAGGSIDTDIVIGSLEEPEIVILVTNSSSAKNSLEKFWRNMGEILEGAKILKTPPKIVEVNLEGEFRKALSKGMSVTADIKLSIADLKDGPEAVKMLRELATKNTRAGQDRTNSVQDMLMRLPKVHNVASELGREVNRIRQSNSRAKLSAIKVTLDQIAKGSAIGRKDTFLRRGIAKTALLYLSSSNGLQEQHGSLIWIGKVPRYAKILGLINTSCGSNRIVDRDIIWCTKHLGLAQSIDLARRSIAERKKNWLAWHLQISNDSINSDHQFIQDNFHDLSRDCRVAELICEQHRKGYKWLFAHIMEVIKSSTGKRQGYGYSALAKDVGYSKGISSGYLTLSDWINGHLELTPNHPLLVDVSKALSSRIRSIGYDSIEKIGQNIEEEYFSNLLEQKIVCYWLFEPLRMLIEDHLTANAIPFRLIKKNPTFIGESLGDPLGIAAPTAIVTRNTLIYWNSAYDKGRHHKTKELMGRGLSLRITWNGKEYEIRESLKKTILLIDGTWEQKQVNALARCGWDEIYYPHEMDQLAKAIV